MAKKIKEIHDQIDLLTAKGRIGYHSRADIDTAVYMASKWQYNQYYSIYEQTNEISDSMAVFLSDPTPLTLTAGKFTLPANFVHEVGEISAGTSNRKVKRLTHAQLSARRNSALVPPTATYPVCVFYKTYIQFYPTDITNVIMTYLLAPVQPVYAFTIVNGREVYNDAASVDIEWSVDDLVKITDKALEVLSQNLQNPLLSQYAANKSNKDE